MPFNADRAFIENVLSRCFSLRTPLACYTENLYSIKACVFWLVEFARFLFARDKVQDVLSVCVCVLTEHGRSSQGVVLNQWPPVNAQARGGQRGGSPQPAGPGAPAVGTSSVG